MRKFYYLTFLLSTFINAQDIYIGSNEILTIGKNSFMVCHSCGLCKPTIEQANELSYKEMQDFDYRPQFTYDKRSHLEDWLRRFQSKENRSIPQEILDKVILESQKERISDLNTLTEEKIKRYLKRLSLNDYYDNLNLEMLDVPKSYYKVCNNIKELDNYIDKFLNQNIK